MRDSVISSEELHLKIRKKVLHASMKIMEKNLHQKGCLCQSLAEGENPIGVRFFSRKWKKILSYLVIYYYYPLDPKVFCYLKLDLQEFIGQSESYFLSALLQSNERFLKFLELQTVMTEQQWFSGICNTKNIYDTLCLIRFSFEKNLSQPRRLVRRKGYRDKGSLGDISSHVIQKEWKNDFLNLMMEYQLEERKQIKSQETLLFASYLDEGRVLTDELLVKFHLKKGNQNEYELGGEYPEEREETAGS